MIIMENETDIEMKVVEEAYKNAAYLLAVGNYLKTKMGRQTEKEIDGVQLIVFVWKRGIIRSA